MKLDTTKYAAMVANAAARVKISSTIFKNFIADVKSVIDGNDDAFNAHLAETAAKHIKESGSNENGRYIRFDDGTLMCWRSNLSLAYNGTDLLQGVWVYPASFFDALATTVTWTAETSIANKSAFHHEAEIGLTTANIRARANSGTFASGDTITVRCFAIGRWK